MVNIQEIKSLLENISPEPWMATLNDENNNKQKWLVECGTLNDVHTIAQIDWECLSHQKYNAEFIAKCRQLVPEMLDEIIRLRETVRELKQA